MKPLRHTTQAYILVRSMKDIEIKTDTETENNPIRTPDVLPPVTQKPEKKRLIHRWVVVMIVIVCLLVAGGAVAVHVYNDHQKHVVKQESSQVRTDFANIDFDTTTEWNDQYELNVMYPKTGQGQIDKTARAKIDTYVSDFRAQVASKPKGGKPYELNIIGAVNYASKTAINFVYTGHLYLDSSISGNITVNALFDRTTGKEIKTSDLFKDGKYLQVASDTARQALPGILSQNYNKTLAEQGTTPTAAHFDQFEIVDAKKINLVFEPGQVAAASAGTVKVPLNLANLDSDLNNDVVGKIFPDYLAQVEAAEKKAQESAVKGNAPPLLANGNVDCSKAKCIALTFDDGPGPGSAVILDTLEKYQAHATFMVVGSRVATWADTLKREVADGNDIGNHTWDHSDLTNLSAADAEAEVSKTQDAVANVTGRRPFMVRPPYGAYNQTVINEIGLPFIMWGVDPDDWRDRDAGIVYQRVMSQVAPGEIVLSHDLYPTTAAAYQRIIPDLISQGYTLVTVSDLLNIDPNNPPAQVFSSR